MSDDRRAVEGTTTSEPAGASEPAWPVYGTADRESPVSRADFERAVRSLNMSDQDLRAAMLQLAARVVALTDELTRRVDGVEPLPAPPNTPATPPTATVEIAVAEALPDALMQVRAADAQRPTRVSLDLGDDKYEAEAADVPCGELIPLCKAACCRLTFALSTQDLDEGIIRWDYGQPYLIRQRASDGYCVHNDPASGGCTVHPARPRVCRVYDCRQDERIWIDFERRIPAARLAGASPDDGSLPDDPEQHFDLFERANLRADALRREMRAVSETFADGEPRRGPAPKHDDT